MQEKMSLWCEEGRGHSHGHWEEGFEHAPAYLQLVLLLWGPGEQGVVW